MLLIKQLRKHTLSLIILLSLTACNSPFTSVKKDNVNSRSSNNANVASKSTWQKTYGEPQEQAENQLADDELRQITAIPTTDLWQRIRDGYAIKVTQKLHPDTEQQLTRFINQPDYINIVAERARPYLHYIVDELERRGMPLELALLPVVESAYQPFAFSSGSAAGIWQFIPGTGKVYGLDQNWWYDGRRDILESTRAALDYLQKLHNDFGNWQLALAAYNSGEGTVGRAIKRNIRLGKDTDFWSLDLPKETSAYVPKLLAIAEIIKQPRKYNLTLTSIDNSPFLTVVETGSQFDLALAAKLAGITTDEIYQLNPGYNRWATTPDGPHRIVLPVTQADIFQQALESMPIEDRVQWTRHKIHSGDTLDLIAKHYKTTVSVLKKANGLTSSFIRAGKSLLIPVAEGKTTEYPLNVTQEMPTNMNDTIKGHKIIHTVVVGDTWWDIAKANNVAIKQLTQWNDLTSKDTLHLGQKLVIWQTKGSISSLKKINYITKIGDSFWKISQQFKVSIAELLEWNGLSERTLLQPGQNLTLHISKTKHGKSI